MQGYFHYIKKCKFDKFDENILDFFENNPITSLSRLSAISFQSSSSGIDWWTMASLSTMHALRHAAWRLRPALCLVGLLSRRARRVPRVLLAWSYLQERGH